MEASPTVLMAMWAGGLAAGGALVARWRVVGRGYVWLTAGVVGMVGLGLGLISEEVSAWVAAAIVLATVVFASRSNQVAAAFGVAAVLFVIAALVDSPVAPLVSGALLLGGVTTEMMLGHWFLVDPTLPRSALTRLGVISGVGLGADVVVLIALGLISDATGDAVLGWAYVALTLMTGLLILGVVLALKEPSYTGVMAATGLSYLAVLTAFGVAVVGRMLVA